MYLDKVNVNIKKSNKPVIIHQNEDNALSIDIKDDTGVQVSLNSEKNDVNIFVNPNDNIEISSKEEDAVSIKILGYEKVPSTIKDIEYIVRDEYTYYSGPYIVAPKSIEQRLETNGLVMRDNVIVKKIYSASVSNEYGTTFIIGE